MLLRPVAGLRIVPWTATPKPGKSRPRSRASRLRRIGPSALLRSGPPHKPACDFHRTGLEQAVEVRWRGTARSARQGASRPRADARRAVKAGPGHGRRRRGGDSTSLGNSPEGRSEESATEDCSSLPVRERRVAPAPALSLLLRRGPGRSGRCRLRRPAQRTKRPTCHALTRSRTSAERTGRAAASPRASPAWTTCGACTPQL